MRPVLLFTLFCCKMKLIIFYCSNIMSKFSKIYFSFICFLNFMIKGAHVRERLSSKEITYSSWLQLIQLGYVHRWENYCGFNCMTLNHV